MSKNVSHTDALDQYEHALLGIKIGSVQISLTDLLQILVKRRFQKTGF